MSVDESLFHASHSIVLVPHLTVELNMTKRREDEAVCGLLTAAPQSVEGGRRAEAGGSGAAARTAGTMTLYPAGARVHKLNICMKVDVLQTEYYDSSRIQKIHDLTEGEEEMECNLKK